MYYIEKVIPPIFIMLPYEIRTESNPEYREFELRFDIELSFESRVRVVKKIIDDYDVKLVTLD